MSFDRARLRALAANLAALHAPRPPMDGAEWEEWAVAADEAADEWTGATQPSTVLALLDALDAAERERDEAVRIVGDMTTRCVDAEIKRDAAVALLRECRDDLEWWSNAQNFMPDDQAELLNRIDALLGGGEGV